MANRYDEENKIAYLDHPLSVEDKKAAKELGYKILDSYFDPNPETEKPVKVTKAKEA